MSQTSQETPMSFNPVVSLVCWMLGTAYIRSSDENLNRNMSTSEKFSNNKQKFNEVDEPRKNIALTWRDERGGNINEYITVVQDPSTPPPSSSPERFRYEETVGTQLARKNPSIDIIDGETCTPSPSWGFYVSITPPRGEEKAVRDIASINEDYRRKSSSAPQT